MSTNGFDNSGSDAGDWGVPGVEFRADDGCSDVLIDGGNEPDVRVTDGRKSHGSGVEFRPLDGGPGAEAVLAGAGAGAGADVRSREGLPAVDADRNIGGMIAPRTGLGDSGVSGARRAGVKDSGAAEPGETDSAQVVEETTSADGAHTTLPMMRDLTDSELLERLKRTGDARRALDAETAAIAQELASRSASELGQQSLARRLGFRNAVAATSYFGSASHATAKQLIKVGRAGTSRTNLTGELVPPRYERIASAVASADLPVEAAALIVEFLDEVEDRATPENLKLAESTLVDIAPKMTVPELRKAIRNIADMVDPDGAEPSAEERHRKRSLRFVERADGMIELHGVLDAATAAPIKVSVDAIVTTWIRNSRGFNSVEDSVTGTVRNPDGSIADEATAPVGVETRSITQMYADALKLIAEHANGCNEVPESGTKVIVRMQLDSLLAEIDGVSGNISAAEARRLAASAGIIPEVLGGDSEILDLGRTQRLASPAQRLALVERDGGCAFCGLEPSKCEAHHFDWWNRDNGPTDLRNLILLCSACHHRIHAEEWDVRIVPPGKSPLDENLEGESDARGRSRPGEPRAPLRMAANDEVWFLPPESLLHDRTPRLGGRKRFHPKLTPERSLEV